MGEDQGAADHSGRGLLASPEPTHPVIREALLAPGRACVEAMLGPTGNLRAPAIRAGKTVLIGFNEEVFADVLG